MRQTCQKKPPENMRNNEIARRNVTAIFFSPVILLLVALSTSGALGQVGLNSLSFGAGVIGTLYPPGNSEPYVFYPEVQLEGEFFRRYIDWSVYWGYWNDRIDQLDISDAIVYSSSGHIIGGRIVFIPSLADEHWTVPVAIFGGIAHQFMSITYVGGEDNGGRTGSDHTAASNTLELGLRISLAISDPIQLRAEAHQLFELTNEYSRHRRAYKLGVSVAL